MEVATGNPIDSGRLGYWSPITATIDWCEENYTHSPYVAEWWNTMSSIPIVLCGLFGLFLVFTQKYERRFTVCYSLLAITGLGSMAFHGTLLYAGQASDELGMVYTSLAFLYTILQTNGPYPPDPPERNTAFDHFKPQTRLNFEHLLPADTTVAGAAAAAAAAAAASSYAIGPDGMPYYTGAGGGGGGHHWSEDEEIMEYTQNGLIVFGLLFTIAYLSSPDFFKWFVLLYIGCILILLRNSMAIYNRTSTPKHQKYLIATSFGMYAFGFLCCWIPGEILFPCDVTAPYHLHAIFHITGSVGPFMWLAMAVWQRYTFRGKRPEVHFGVTAPIPYVVIPIKPATKKE